ncbi:MAG: hypothetical protein ABF328_09215 [Akkermansiaceae bacterium]
MQKEAGKTFSIILLIFWAAMALVVFNFGSRIVEGISFMRDGVGSMFREPDPQPAKGELSEKQRLILQGDVTQDTRAKRWLALHEFEPENPVYYANYLNQVDEPPKDFRETIKRIDPDNGWFLIWEATLDTDFIIEKQKSLSSRKREQLKKKSKPIPPRDVNIIDEPAFEKRIQLLELAVQSKKFNNYYLELAEERHAALPPKPDVVGNIENLVVIGQAFSPNIHWKYLSDLMSAGIQSADTPEKFARFEKLALALEERSYQSISTLVEGLIYRAIISMNSTNLRIAAERHDLEQKAQIYREREKIGEDYRDSIASKEAEETEKLLSRRAGIIASLSIPAIGLTVKTPPSITRADLHANLRAERAIASRMLYGVGFIFLSLVTLLTWIRKRNKSNPAAFIPELRLLLIGVLLPFGLLLFFRYFLSFGMLDYGGHLLVFWNYLLPAIGTLIIMLCAPVCLLRTRAFPEATRLKIWWPLGTAVLALFLSAAMMALIDIEVLQNVIVLAAPVLMVITLIGLVFPRVGDNRVEFDLTARLAPAYLFAACLFGLFIIGLQFEERYWVAKDDFMKPIPQGFTTIENEIVEILKIELRELKPE